jgi:nickel-type superoxide dismutase maturation protease
MLLRRVLVAGDSMVPTLRSGDRLVVIHRRRVRIGDIVAAHDPRDSRVVVKRIAAIDTDHRLVVLVGDNPDASTDSRTFGPVARSAIVGRAIYRYAPATRAGRIG